MRLETWRGEGKGKETVGGSTGFLRDRAGWKAGHCRRPYLFWNPRAVGAVESRGHVVLRTWESGFHGGEHDDGLDRLWGWIREREIT